MAEAEQYIVQEAMRLLRVDDPYNSRDEDIAMQRVMQASLKNSNSLDSCSDDASDLPVSGNADEGQPLSNQNDTLLSRAGVA